MKKSSGGSVGAKGVRRGGARRKQGAEKNPSSGTKCSRRAASEAARLGAIVLTGSFAIAQVPVYAAGALPIPCPGSGSACVGGAGKALGFDLLNTGSSLTRSANTLTINQSANNAIFNWASFNISTGNTVDFIQPSNSSVALNRIFDPNVTTISGNLVANGQIYLINPNGILFGSGANVNVAGLIASTSNLDNSRITSGLLSNTYLFTPVFTANSSSLDATSAADSPVAGANANPSIVVQPGATLYAAGRDQAGTVVSAGRVFLFAPTVENGGNIQVDGGGQVILAAGSDIYLGSSSEASLRGLLVEVTGSSAAGVTVDASGTITVAHGNITLMGLAVSQAGTLTATSALDANGSIYLLAREANPSNTTTPSDPTQLIMAGKTGTVNVESGSSTVVSLDPYDTATAPLDDTTAASMVSTINIQGAAVNIGGNGAGTTLIQAHGGQINVTARLATSEVVGTTASTYQLGDGSVLGASDLNDPSGNGNINVGSNAVIDVSGLQNVAVDGSREFVYTELTSLNLANAPYQRAGLLLDKYVYLNLADVPSWINVTSLEEAIAGTQAERNTVGGTISLNAVGTVNLAKGSVLNVSGGTEVMTPAIGRVTDLLTANGQVVSLSNASATTQYVAFAGQGSYTDTDSLEGVNTTTSWQVPSYTQIGGFTLGQNAGTVQIYSSAANLNGTMLGNVTVGATQRSSPPQGGLLRIGSSASGDLDSEAGISRPSILLGANSQALQQLAADLQSNTSGPVIDINTTTLTQGGFTRLDLSSDGVIELAPGSPLNLGVNGSFSAHANAVLIDSSISAPGGTITLGERALSTLPADDTNPVDETAQLNVLSLVSPGSTLFGTIAFGQGVSLSTAGLWTNDELLGPDATATSPIALNGGKITVSAQEVNLSGASFDVSAGAWLAQNGAFSGGNGGSLSFSAMPLYPVLATAPTSANLVFGTDFASRIAGYGVATGGTLSITSWALQLGEGSTQGTNTVIVDPAVAQTGFQTFNFNGYALDDVSVGTQFAPQMRYLEDTPALNLLASGSSLLAVTAPQAPVAGVAAPATVNLNATDLNGATIEIGKGAVVNAGVEGTIALNGFSEVLVDGTLQALAGTVSLQLGAQSQDSNLTTTEIDTRSVQLGPDAVINVSGTSLVTQMANGLRTGSVLNGGSVSLDAFLGTVAVDPGARILANGTSDMVDVQGQASQYQLQSVASSGGTVQIAASSGIILEGSIQGAGGSATANGGSLSVALQDAVPNSNETEPGVQAQLGLPATLNIGNAGLPALTGFQSFFTPNAQGAQAWVTTALANNSGFEQVWLQSADNIRFTQSMTLGKGATTNPINSLVLSAAVLVDAPGVSVTVAAPYVALGTAALLDESTSTLLSDAMDGSGNTATPTGSSGTGSFTASAQQLDLVGSFALQGIGQANLESTGDVRAIGILGVNGVSTRATGSLSFGGNLTISAAQLYPATQTDFTFSFAPAGTAADAANGQLTVATNPQAGTPLAPLSAGGSLTFDVNDFTVTGRVSAPLGEITVNASQITLDPGSVLSIQGSGLVPYGSVANGATWTYGIPDGYSGPVSIYTIGSSSGTALPSKGISLNATSGTVDAKSGSTIDIAGGGDTLGTDFVAGPGGSYDMSLNFPYGTTTRNSYFALVPVRGTAMAGWDPQVYSDLTLDTGLPSVSYGSFSMGETIRIGAGSSLPAGTYTILPIRYALLPGAYAVEAVSGYAGINPSTSVQMPDGTVVVAGKLGYAAAGTSASLWSAFRVYTETQFRTLSEDDNYYGSTFFATAASEAQQAVQRLGQDAGSLQIAASELLLASTIETAPASGGRGAEIAIDVPNIVVGNFATPAASPQSTVQLDATTLTRLGAETIILGAIDTGSANVNTTDGNQITLSNPVAAESVQVEAGTLSAGQVLLAAPNVSVSSGATVSALTSRSPITNSVVLTGDGAALYVGNVSTLPSWDRTNASLPGTATIGNLTIASGATVQGEAVLFDATDTQSYSPGLSVVTSNLELSSSLVNVGAVPAGASGLNLSTALLEDFANVGNLTVASVGGINVYGTTTLGEVSSSGATGLDSLTFITPGLSGFGASSDTFTINAGHVALNNTLASTGGAYGTVVTAGTGLGSLDIKSVANATNDGNVVITGSVALSGFSSVAIDAVGRVQSSGSSSQSASGTGELAFGGSAGASATLSVAGTGASLTVNSAVITAQRGVNATVTVPGALVLGSSSPAPASNQQTELGASLTLQAQSVEMGGRIDLPAGLVDISATDDITLESGSSIRVAGMTQSFASTTADVSAGSITLASATGSIVQQANATIDLDGAGVEGDAGSLSLSAPSGTVSLGGSITAGPGSSARGADFTVDAGTIASLTSLAQTFTAATGSAGADSIDVRARNGNLSLTAGSTLQASTIILQADGGGGATDGSVDIAGTLNASGSNGGSIQIYANYQAVLSQGASLNASATGSNGSGGEVLISSRVVANPINDLFAIWLQSGSSINVAGSGSGSGGTVILRAPRVGSDVSITVATGSSVTGTLNDAGTTDTGINEMIVEAMQVYSAADNVSIAADPNVVLNPSLTSGNVLTTAQADAMNFMDSATGVSARLAALGGISLRPGIEIDTTGTITLPSSTTSVLDFDKTGTNGDFLWRYGGNGQDLATSTPGELTLRAGGGINIGQSVSDGFAASSSDSSLKSTVNTAGDSWSYVLTAGADLTAANPDRTSGIAANLTIGTATSTNPVTIRTGTGSIALNASGDVILDNGANQQGNVVYTAGVNNVVATDASGNALQFPILDTRVGSKSETLTVTLDQWGGDLSVHAGQDVLGTALSGANQEGSTQNVNEWLMRGGLGTVAAPTVWWVNYGTFQQGFGALGGGNLTMTAGGNIVRVGAVVASNGWDSGTGLTQINTGALNVRAGGTIEQGLYYNQGGSFDLEATSFTSNTASTSRYQDIRLAQGSNEVNVQARESAQIEVAFNPTIAGPSVLNVGTDYSATASYIGEFFTYTDSSSFNARVAAGDLTLMKFIGTSNAIIRSIGYEVNAPNLELISFGGSVIGANYSFSGLPNSPDGIIMASSPTGQLRILADGSISGVQLLMTQADPSVIPTTTNPAAQVYETGDILAAQPFNGINGASLHANDPTTAEVVARTGSIGDVYLGIPKTTEIAAGDSIGGDETVIYLQNSNAGSVSTVSGGQSINLSGAGNIFTGINIDGPGVLQVISGGAMNLGTDGSGILSRGNLDNANLNAVGASLIVAAGTGRDSQGFAALPDYSGLIKDFVQYDAFASTGSASSTLDQQVLTTLAGDSSMAALVQALEAGLANRSSASNASSTFSQDLAKLTPAQIAEGAVKLAAAIQVVNNQVFVDSSNSDTFAPGYMAFADLFPGLDNNAGALQQFVLNNVFAKSPDGAALQAQALQGLPSALVQVIDLGLASPGSVTQSGSAFSKALAALDPTVLASGMRQLMANVLSVAGTSLNQLKASGSLTGSGSPYATELTAFALAFSPTTAAGLNDLNMDYNEIKTQETGSVAVFTPQGSVIVGQASPPALDQEAAGKTPDVLGIFTYGGGDIIGMARDSFNVYQSRVFTVAGGDIELWASEGNIDAGRGPRDVAVVPPPTLIINSAGVEELDLSATVTGSGIGALVTEADQPASNINLMAPVGYVDAGEAGIRAQGGSVTLGTNLVLNAGNIQAASGVSGGAVVATPPPPLPPSVNTNAGEKAVEEAQREAMVQQQQAAAAASQRQMRITGDFIGFEDCDTSSGAGSDCTPSKRDEHGAEKGSN